MCNARVRFTACCPLSFNVQAIIWATIYGAGVGPSPLLLLPLLAYCASPGVTDGDDCRALME
jgi:hypothetical protein